MQSIAAATMKYRNPSNQITRAPGVATPSDIEVVSVHPLSWSKDRDSEMLIGTCLLNLRFTTHQLLQESLPLAQAERAVALSASGPSDWRKRRPRHSPSRNYRHIPGSRHRPLGFVYVP